MQLSLHYYFTTFWSRKHSWAFLFIFVGFKFLYVHKFEKIEIYNKFFTYFIQKKIMNCNKNTLK